MTLITLLFMLLANLSLICRDSSVDSSVLNSYRSGCGKIYTKTVFTTNKWMNILVINWISLHFSTLKLCLIISTAVTNIMSIIVYEA